MKKKDSLYMGLDISSTHIKVAAYEQSGNLVAVASTPTPVHMSKDGGIYHLGGELREKSIETIHDCMERLQGRKIKAIGVSSVAESGVLLDEDGRTLEPVLAWYDPRPNQYLQVVNSEISTAAIYRKTGLFPEAKHSLLKMLWMKEHMQEVWRQGKTWLHIAEYIVYCLTGEIKSEYSLASRSMLLDVSKRQWDTDLLHTFGIDAKLMPELVQAGKVHGHVHKEASELTKIPAGTPVTIAGHHPIVGAYGIGGVLDGDVTNVCDMMETLIITVPQQDMEKFRDAQPFSIGCHVASDHHYAMLDVGTTGGIIQWFLSITGWDHAKLMNALSKANGVHPNLGFYPTSIGDGTSDNHMQMAWFGGQLTNSYPEQMAAAMIQGLSCLFRYRMDELRRLQLPLKRLLVAGESTKNAYWMQVKADLFNSPIQVCRKWEGSSRGAAVLAAKSIDEIGEFAIPPSMTVSPNTNNRDEIEDFYQNSYLKNMELLNNMIME